MNNREAMENIRQMKGVVSESLGIALKAMMKDEPVKPIGKEHDILGTPEWIDHCPNCGKEFRQEATNYCGGCGYKLDGGMARGNRMRTIKQLFCKHHWSFVARNTIVNEVLGQCDKCGIYKVWHRWANMEYKSKEFPTNKGWPEVTE